MLFTIQQEDSVDSTNQYLQDVLRNKEVDEGFVVQALEQKSGRGYGANNWESEKGKNLTFSLLLKPVFIAPEGQFLLTQIVSLAIFDLLQEIIPNNEEIRIKWPNDIYIGNKKVAGILIQNFIKGHFIDQSIIGIGLNVNQLQFFTDAPNPVSLIRFTSKILSLTELLDRLLLHLGKYYEQSVSGQFREEIQRRYLSRLYRFWQTSVFSVDGQNFQASIKGIGEFGRLILEHKDGHEQLYAFKEIEFVITD